MNFQTVKFRCHRLGDLMSNGRGKDTLGQTCINYLAEVYVEMKYNRRKDIENRYITKGLQVEEDSMTAYAVHQKRMFKKNEQRLTNDYLSGLPDIIESDLVTDLKSSWDITTFFATHVEKLNKTYYWQLMGYLALTNLKRARLAYALINTPQALIDAEKRKLAHKVGITDETYNQDFEDACEALQKYHTYSDIPMKQRVNIIELSRNEDDINAIYERVKVARNWMAENFGDK